MTREEYEKQKKRSLKEQAEIQVHCFKGQFHN